LKPVRDWEREKERERERERERETDNSKNGCDYSSMSQYMYLPGLCKKIFM
jgi:hypothetical protein